MKGLVSILKICREIYSPSLENDRYGERNGDLEKERQEEERGEGKEKVEGLGGEGMRCCLIR